MSGESSATGAGEPTLNLTPDEKRAYGQLFRQADGEGVGVVTGEVAVKFFDKTRLDSRVLGEIWQIADKENRGFLTPAGFGVVLRLIGHAQAGREPTPEISLQPGPLPRFDGITLASAPGPVPSSPTQASPIQAQGTGGGVRIPPLLPEKAAQYAGLFERQSLQNNMLSGDQAKSIFEKAGLPNEVLGRIWQLADTEQRGALVATEFVIAMHLLTSMKTGTLRALPTVLPAALYEAATRRGSVATAPRQSPMNTGLSAIPRQLSGTAQVRTGSPLGRPPIGPQGTGAGADWAVAAADKAKFDQFYADLDKSNKGYITGDEAVPFFSQSGLGEDSLAQIWDLSDIKSQGQLTRDEFAVSMHLIKQQRMNPGQPLPKVLPANLIPPSLRTQARPPPTMSAFDPPPVPQPAPPKPRSAMEDLFDLDTTPSSSPAPPAPLQTTMSTGGSNADPFAGGSSNFGPSSPLKASATGSQFKPFVPSSSFGRGLTTQSTGDAPTGAALGSQGMASDDLLGDNDAESKNISGESTELANLSNQVSSLSKQMQETQGKRNATQNELNQTNAQKQTFEQRLAQLRTLYEKEAQDTRALEEKLRQSRAETSKFRGECMTLEGTYRDIQTQHQQVLAQLQADQQENTGLREKIRVVNAEIAQLKPQIEKLKSEARQQKGLVAINKKQLSTTEGERDKFKGEAEELTKSNEELSRQVNSASPALAASQVASPALSTSSGNNPFFKRSASADIMGVFASPPPRTATDKSFDEVFGPSSNTPPPVAPAPFKPQVTGASTISTSSTHNPGTSSPSLGKPATLAADPPAPPESRQMSSSFLPFPDHSDSLSSSRQVSPPASRAEGSGNDAQNPFPGDFSNNDTIVGGNEVAEDRSGTPVPAASVQPPPATAVEERPESGADDPFSATDQAKAKADFDNAFAAFTSAKEKPSASSDAFAPPPPAAAASEFPPISELDRDDSSDSESDEGGFDDDFAPASPEAKLKSQSTTAPEAPASSIAAPQAAIDDDTPAVPPKEPFPADQPSSPATITNSNANTTHAGAASTVDDIFGAAGTGEVPDSKAAAPSQPPPKGAFDDLDDDFEGLEDAKEGSADDDFANISRSGLDDFHPTFDSSPPASQAKSESTAFGNESSFDFVSSNSATGAPTAATGGPATQQQQGAGDAHDWDAIFAGLDSPAANAEVPTVNEPAGAQPEKPLESRPEGPGRALTDTGEHDDPILKNLTGMGYSRTDALSALEKYDYNLERAANFLASQS